MHKFKYALFANMTVSYCFILQLNRVVAENLKVQNC